MTIRNFHWRSFKNSFGEPVPPFGCMQVVSVSQQEPRTFTYTITQPDGAPAAYLLNGATSVDSGQFGDCIAGGDALAALNDRYDPGTKLGPIAGQWSLGLGSELFEVLGSLTSSLGIVRFGSTSTGGAIFWTTQIIPAASGVDPEILMGSALATRLVPDSTGQLTVAADELIFNEQADIVPATTRVQCKSVSGLWVVDSVPCP